MLSTMMDDPLTVNHIFWRMERLYRSRAVVTQRAEGEPSRATYAQVASRVRRLASALAKQGVRSGDRVATLGWNTQTHLECYFAIPSMGAVLHTLNVRLFPGQLEYIINHAEDHVIFADRSAVSSLETLAGKMPTVRLLVLMNEGPEPPSGLGQTVDYEEFLKSGDDSFEWPDIDERQAAAMCYTSGTTGNPKGVVYSHRSTMVHSLVAALPNNLDLSERDVVSYAVPMFHANAWGIPYAAAMVGAAQVMTNRFLDAERLMSLFEREKVTFTAGVPTVWLPILNAMETVGRKLPSLKRIVCGGSAAPPTMIAGFQRHGIQLVHAWGMTETSPLASLCRTKASMETLPDRKKLEVLAKQGMITPTVECRIVDMETRQELPWDGVAIGELQVRGPYVTGTYYHDPDAAEKFMDGWLRTGDVASIDPDGYLQLVDRIKDLVKSGGEWISSVELENEIMAHPQVLEAAVVGLPHPRWQERPVAAVVPRPEFKGRLSSADVIAFLTPRVAKWWLPDEVVFIDAIPRTSVGKFAKSRLREQLNDVARRWAAAG